MEIDKRKIWDRRERQTSIGGKGKETPMLSKTKGGGRKGH